MSEKTVIRSNLTKAGHAYREDDLTMATSYLVRRPISDAVTVAQAAYLEVFGVQKKSLGYELDTKEAYIGRGSDCQIHLPLHGVSRLHARIFCHNEEYHIEDLNSTNGTYVNGVEVVKCVLRSSDQIEIGEAKIIFVEEKTRQRS